MTRYNILTRLQQTVLDSLFADDWFRRYFYLTGGTALAEFYLGHRYSDDLDFFSNDTDLGPIEALLKTALTKKGLRVEQLRKAPNSLRYSIENDLQLDFVSDVDFRVGDPQFIDQFMVDSLKNIAVNKVGAILGRLEIKDYVDLFLIMQKSPFDIFELFELGQKKDAGLEPFVWAGIVSDVSSLKILPRMILEVDLKDIETWFHDLRDQILDRIQPPRP